jgi:serine/threonine protein kinase
LDANQTLLHYRIIDLLGEGGAGVVYKARDTRLDRIVVVKILKKSLASQEGGRERFLGRPVWPRPSTTPISPASITSTNGTAPISS